jgi:fumarate reductase subunit D
MRQKRPAEPFLWLAFSAGGVAAALVLPILLLLFGLAIPLGWLSPDYAHLHTVVAYPLVRLGLLAVCVLALVHAAHRLRHTVTHGLRLGHLAGLIAAVCYGGALVGSVAAAAVLFS